MLAVKVNPPTQKEEQSQPQQQEEKPRNETAIMGTTFSSTSSSSTSQSLRNESRDETSTMQVDCSSSSSDNKPNSSSTSTATSSSSSRKRKRNEISSDSSSSSSSSDAAKASSTSTKVQTKKPKKETIWSRYFSSTWNSFTDSFTCCFSKVFLLAAEMACKNASPGELAHENDLINGVCQSLDFFQTSDADVLRRGWRVLCACSGSCDDKESILRLFQEDVSIKSNLSAVLTAMERHGQVVKIQLLGFRAIRQLLSECDDSWDILVDVKAIPILLQAMKNHSSELIVQGLGMTFLAMLARDSSGQPREQVIEMGAVHVILDAMKNFLSDCRLLHTAFFALHQLGFSSAVREIIRTLDGRPLFVKVLEKHMSDVGVVDLSLAALGKLGDDAEGVVSALPVVLRAMRHWPESSSTQGHGLAYMTRGIGHLPLHSVEAAIQHRVMVNDVIRHVTLVMRNHPTKTSIQFFSCAVIREILERIPTPTIRKRVLEEGTMESVVEALKNHRQTYGLQPMGLLVLLNIYEHRTPEEVAASVAFGGSHRAIAAIAGMTMEIISDPEENVI